MLEISNCINESTSLRYAAYGWLNYILKNNSYATEPRNNDWIESYLFFLELNSIKTMVSPKKITENIIDHKNLNRKWNFSRLKTTRGRWGSSACYAFLWKKCISISNKRLQKNFLAKYILFISISLYFGVFFSIFDSFCPLVWPVSLPWDHILLETINITFLNKIDSTLHTFDHYMCCTGNVCTMQWLTLFDQYLAGDSTSFQCKLLTKFFCISHRCFLWIDCN